MLNIALGMLAHLGGGVWRTSLQGALVVLLIGTAQLLLRRHLPPRWCAAPWLIVMAQLLLPWQPRSPLSLYQGWSPPPAPAEPLFKIEARPDAALSIVARFDPPPESVEQNDPTLQPPSISEKKSSAARMASSAARPKDIPAARIGREWGRRHPFVVLWLAGALGLGLAVAVRTLRIAGRVARVRPVTAQALLDLLEDCKGMVGVRVPVSLVETAHAHGPMMLGFIRPRLLLPAGLSEMLTHEQLRFIFLHELAHLRRRDILWGWLMTLALVVHWFNPLVWLASLRLRADRELACDAEALEHLRAEQRTAYGRTIVQLLESLAPAPYLPTIAGIMEDKVEMKRRVLMIAKFKRPVWWMSMMGGVLTLLVAVSALTQPGPEGLRKVETTTDAGGRWVDKVDYPFANDPALPGSWKFADFVKKMEDFTPGQRSWPGKLFLLGISIKDDGGFVPLTAKGPFKHEALKWTQGLFLNTQDRTASRYLIKTMGGTPYLFMEWKTGDYVIRHSQPSFYVFEKGEPGTEDCPPAGQASAAASSRAVSPANMVMDTPVPPLPPLSLGIKRHPQPAYYGRPISELPVYEPDSGKMWQVDLRCRDISRLKLAGRLKDLMEADFDSKTRWPATLPAGFNPQQIATLGINPGLGVRQVHARGITGKGVGLAIIDQALLVDHVEYKDQLRHYEEIHWLPQSTEASMHGPAVASIAVGKSVGVAPGADLYYIAEWHGNFAKQQSEFVMDFRWLAQSIERVLEINRTLPAGKKIRVISISVGWNPGQKGYQEVTAAVAKAKAEGLFVVSSSLRNTFGMNFHGLGRAPLSDPELAASYEPGLFWRKGFYQNASRVLQDGTLLVPMDSRGTASPTGDTDYVYYREGGWSWSIPYIAGLYALACQVRPDVTPELFWKAALETGVVNQVLRDGENASLGRIVQPTRLIEKLAPAK